MVRRRKGRTWETMPLREFEARFQQGRKVFRRPLQTIFNAIGESLQGSQQILIPGIGPGLLEQWLGIPGNRLIGMDINKTLLTTAQAHHQGIRIVEGDFTKSFPEGPHFDTILFTNSLDVVPPGKLDGILTRARQSTQQLVVTQDLSPNTKYWKPQTLRRKEGIKHWPDRYLHAVTQSLNQAGVVASPQTQPLALLKQLENVLFTTPYKTKLTWGLADACSSANIDWKRIKTSPHTPFIAQIDSFLYQIHEQLSQKHRQLKSQGMDVLTLSQIDTIKVLLTITKAKYTEFLFFTFVEHALRQSGWQNIQFTNKTALNDQVVEPSAALTFLNRSLESARKKEYSGGPPNYGRGVFITGGLGGLLYPHDGESFQIASIGHLVAESSHTD